MPFKGVLSARTPMAVKGGSSRMFLGEKVEYVVSCAGLALQVVRASTASADNLREGASVGIRFADGALTLLGEDDA